ncbi:MAG: tRNA (adenosine(37)-N6)-threonylcarbamoyltransferase complex ATPase subunit type 1 TsaE [Rickettsiales bacterium]|jgi:tRNA threonylcarbamoyl adenosine modification protein YjeE|nr:tRNA (adenosine(37)-N6)-threonylcarbamoyltransferase complex ATPase subunit type 1 TsaE [Rickettsiales bacterium]
MEHILKNVDETRQFARALAKTLHAPKAVALHGDLGMGKSEIARGVIQTLCGTDTVVPSPTFTLVQTYEQPETGGRQRISHFDLYRIEDASELEEIGLMHACANDIALIEWPEIAADKLPADTIHIYITEYGNGRRPGWRLISIDNG